MANGSYLLKRDGRYYLQIRKSRFWAMLTGRQLYRRSLHTSDAREARQAIPPYLDWIWKVNDLKIESAVHLLDRFNEMMSNYLNFPVWNDPKQLRAREDLEREILICRKNIKDQMGIHAVNALCPDFEKNWKDFVFSNLRHREALDDLYQEQFESNNARRTLHSESPKGVNRNVEVVSTTPEPQIVVPPPIAPEINERVQEITNGPVPTLAPTTVDSLVEDPLKPDVLSVESQSPSLVPLKLSDAKEQCLAHHKKKKKNDRQRDVVEPVIDFMIWYYKDPDVLNLTPANIKEFVKLLPLIPNRNSVPAPQRNSFMGRYCYGQEDVVVEGKTIKRLETLVRLTKSTIDGGHLVGIRSVFNYLKDECDWPYKVPKLSVDCDELLSPLPRDAFDEKEILKIITMPLFTGCSSKERIWQPGKYFVQNGLYWGYLIAMMAGMRQGEIVKLDCSDIVERNSVWYFDLRPFDPTNGRVKIKDLKKFKASGSARVVPIHPLLIKLGLLDRKEELEKLGCKRLFPDLHPFIRKNGDIRWGHPLSKSYQYLKRLLNFDRDDVCLYSLRHSYADALDDLALADRMRNRMMGHQMHGTEMGYGRKNRLSDLQVELLNELHTGLTAQVAEPLLAAKDKAESGELITTKPWLTISTWASIDKEHISKKS